MRSGALITTVGGVVLLACSNRFSPSDDNSPPATSGPNLAAQETRHLTFQDPIAFDVVSPCTGELVHITGQQDQQLTIVGPPDLIESGNETHIEQLETVTGTGTGIVSGTTYAIRDVFHVGFDSPSITATHGTFTSVETLHAIGAQQGQSFLIRFASHTTFLPSGEVNTTFDTQASKCIG
jgi:hypothetical protein